MGTTTADGADAHVRVEQNILVANARNGSIAALRSSQRNWATGTLDDEQYDGAGWLGEGRDPLWSAPHFHGAARCQRDTVIRQLHEERENRLTG